MTDGEKISAPAVSPPGDAARTDYGERFRFESLLTDLSARFINVHADQLDAVICDAQRQICEFLKVDVCSLWRAPSEKPDTLVLVQLYHPPDFLPPPLATDSSDESPWALTLMQQGRDLVVACIEDTPPEAEQDRVLWRRLGVKSLVSIPLSVGGERTLGALNLCCIRQERQWDQHLVSRLRLVGQIFANALARQDVERELKESRARLALATSAADIGLWVLDRTGTCFWVNDKISELFGIPPTDELEVARFLAFVHPEDHELVSSSIDAARQSSQLTAIEYRIVRPDGAIRWMFSRGRPIDGAQDLPRLLMGITFDVTDRKNAEERVLQLSLALEQSPASVVITDLQGTIRYVNRKFTEVSGYSREEAIGRNPRILKSGETPPETYQELWACITGGNTWRGEFHNLRKNGELFWEAASISPVVDANGRITHFVGVKEDITAQRRSEQELQQQRQELAHLSRVMTMSELSGSLAHELNQPLAIILTNAEAAQRLLAQEPPDLAEVRDTLADIVSEDQRAGNIIRRLRAMLKPGHTQLEPLSANELVEDVLRIARSDLIGRGITAQTVLDARGPRVTGDRIQLQQVILNLVLNAAEAMAAKAPTQRLLSLATEQRDGLVRISVSDTGCGLPSNVESIFEPFYTTKKEGLGLGLTICRSIVSSHHGRLWAEGRVTERSGATFYMDLPLLAEGQP